MFSPGQMLGMLGGSVVIKSGDVIINKLKAAKVMEPGDMGGLMEKGLPTGLLSKILQNPQSGKGSKAASQASQGAEQLPTFGHGQMTKSAIIDDFMPALNDFMNTSAELVGLGSDPSGLVVTVGYSQILDSLSRADPALSSDKLLGPALRDDALEIAGNVVENSVQEVLAYRLEDYWAAHLIQEQAGILRQIMSDSQWAKDQAEGMAGYAASISIAASMLLSGSPAWRAVMERAFQADSLDEARRSNQAWMTIDDGDEVVTT
jgi:hypothetical protein